MTSPSETPATAEHIPENLDLTFVVGVNEVNQLRKEQHGLIHDAEVEVIKAIEPWQKAFTADVESDQEKALNNVITTFGDRIAQHVDEKLATLSAEQLDRHPGLREKLITLLLHVSVNHVSNPRWESYTRHGHDSDGDELPSEWDRILEALGAEPEQPPVNDDEESDDTDEGKAGDADVDEVEEEPTDDTEITDLEADDRRRKRRRRLIGAAAVAAAAGIASIIAFKYGIDSSHVAPALHGAAGSLPGGRGGGSSAAAVPTPKAPNMPPGGGGSSQNHAEAGVKVLNSRQVDGLKEAWVNQVHGASENANHIMQFVTDKKGGLTIELGGEHLGAFKHMHDLRADITLNVKGRQEMISVPMHGHKLHLTGKLAKLLKRDDFISVKVARLHGEHETIYSTVIGNGREVSGKTLHRLTNQLPSYREARDTNHTGNTTRNGSTGKNTPAHSGRKKERSASTPSMTLASSATPIYENPLALGLGSGAVLAGTGVGVVRHNRKHQQTGGHHAAGHPLERLTTASPDDDLEETKVVSTETEHMSAELQPIIADIDGYIKSSDWIRPDTDRNEYIANIRIFAGTAIDSHMSTVSQGTKEQLINQMVARYCEGSAEEIYDRLSRINHNPAASTA